MITYHFFPLILTPSSNESITRQSYSTFGISCYIWPLEFIHLNLLEMTLLVKIHQPIKFLYWSELSSQIKMILYPYFSIQKLYCAFLSGPTSFSGTLPQFEYLSLELPKAEGKGTHNQNSLRQIDTILINDKVGENVSIVF